MAGHQIEVIKGTPRLPALDIVRGAVMVLMAIDHVRVYSGVPAGGPTAGIFFTRWVTHFCAPAFAFLAGTSAFLYGLKLGLPSSREGTRALARYLVTRGLLLVLLELTVIRAAWTFGVDYSQFILAGVIWMLGWCMVLLSGLIWLPTRAIGTIGLLVILFQDVFAILGRATPESFHMIWEFVYPVGAEVTLGQSGPSIAVLYSIVPWIGVMAAGYAFGAIMVRPPAERRSLCLRIGLSATALYLLIGGLEVFLRAAPDDAPPALFRLLNQRKYPASALFLLMTLGPAIALLPVAERARGWFVDVLATFGRVPMFYYLLHIPVIHATALLVWLARDGSVHSDWFRTAPFVSVPAGQRWGLPLLYLVFLFVIAVLYIPCRWFVGIKARGAAGLASLLVVFAGTSESNQRGGMAKRQTEIMKGTLHLLVLKVLALEPRHGVGVADRIEQTTRGTFQVSPGLLFPVLHRLEQEGFIAGEWSATPEGRRAKYYRITAAGQRRLATEKKLWARVALAIGQVLAE